MNEQPNRIASLDGLRALSIVLVLFHHVAGTQNSFLSTGLADHLALGELGVRVFFVISGFLITGLLFKELEKTSTVHVGKFYFRRTFRIFPPYYALIIVLIILQAAGLILLGGDDVPYALAYLSNYNSDRSWYVAHTWSLAVEEQFYLLWPAVLLMAGKRRALVAAALVIMLCPLIRLGLWYFVPAAQSGVGHRFETVADAIAVGCLLAGAREWLGRQPLYQRLLGSKLFILVPLAVLGANMLHDRPRIYIFLGYTIMNIGIALAIDWCVTNHTGRVGRFLNSAPLVFIGVMSYSIYLWQQVFLNRYSTSFASQFPYNILFVVLASLASFYLIERPSLKLRTRLEKKMFAPGRRKQIEVGGEAAGDNPGAMVATAVAGDQGAR